MTSPARPLDCVSGDRRVDWEEWDADLISTNPLRFPGHESPVEESVRSGLVTTSEGSYVLIECDFSRAGGTMGVVSGEKVTRAYREATRQHLPVAQIVSSGGARLQEGFYALAQMARTVDAQAEHRAAGLLSAAVLASPTTGGVFASWGSGASIRATTTGSVIGFGGPRVVHSVTGEWPPDDSHNGESAYRHGLVDALIPLGEEIPWLERVLGLRTADPLPEPAAVKPAALAQTTPSDAWEDVLARRAASWPTATDWASWLTDDWIPLRGPGDVLIAGIASVGGIRSVVIALGRHGSDSPGTALPRPADFRLAQRAIRLSSALQVPLLNLIDTPGADPSPRSESDGLALEIAQTLEAMGKADTRTVAMCVGEGGSGGAMAFAHADVFLMLDGSVFEVIGPDAGAAVIYRDRTRAPEMARNMGIQARDLLAAGLCDAVLAPDVDNVRTAVVAALNGAVKGARRHRWDAATASSLTTASR